MDNYTEALYSACYVTTELTLSFTLNTLDIDKFLLL